MGELEGGMGKGNDIIVFLFQKLKISFSKTFYFVCSHAHAHLSTSALGVQKVVLSPMELKLQEHSSCRSQVLDSKLGSSEEQNVLLALGHLSRPLFLTLNEE